MSDILIKGMEMPQNCGECLSKHLSPTGESLVCDISLSTVSWNERPFDCPLVPVPPHGRLIEESKVLDIVSDWCPDDDGSVGKDGDLREMLDEIEALPTIIPASGGNEVEEHTMDEFMYGQEGNPNDGSM